MKEDKNKEYRIIRAQLTWRPDDGGDGWVELENGMNVAAKFGFKLERPLEFERQVQGPGLNDKITAIAVMERDQVPEPSPHWSDTVPGN